MQQLVQRCVQKLVLWSSTLTTHIFKTEKWLHRQRGAHRTRAQAARETDPALEDQHFHPLCDQVHDGADEGIATLEQLGRAQLSRPSLCESTVSLHTVNVIDRQTGAEQGFS